MFEKFKNMFSLSKTICFNLNPTEITKKNIEENNDLLLNDLRIRNNEYLVHIAFDKLLNKNNLTVSNELFIDKLVQLSCSYRCLKKNDELKKDYNAYKDDVVKYISDTFKNVEDNKKLFGKHVLSYIKESNLVSDDILSLYTVGRIDQFRTTRKTAIDNIAKRIVLNIELMTENILLMNKLMSANYSFEDRFKCVIDNFNICLYNQFELDEYNNSIAEFNQKLNEDYQNGVLNIKSKFIKLKKSVLSESEPVFTIEQYKSTNDVYKAFEKLFTVYNIANMYKNFKGLFENFENYNLENVFVKNSSVHNLSNIIYGNHSFITDKINEFADKNINNKSKRDKFKKQNFSIKTINDVLGENIFEKIKIDTEAYKDLFSKFMCCSVDSKEYLEHCLNLSNDIINTFSQLVKIFDLDNNCIDAIFYSSINEICDFYKDFNKVFNCTRNFASKKNDFINSYIITWGNNNLNNPGWAESKLGDNRSYIFIKNNKYYFGYLIDKNVSLETTNDIEHSYKRMIYMQLNAGQQIPKMMFTNQVKEHFKNSNENIVLDNGFEMSKEIYDIYFSQKNNKDFFNDNKNALEKYINSIKLFFSNIYNNVYDFSKIKDACEYQTYNDFVCDMDCAMYKIDYENITDECIETLQKQNKLWLFQIYCKDFSDHRKIDSNKNIHTLIFESFFSDENKEKNFPIKLCGGFEIRYRDAGITDGVIHKKGSILLNKNDKNGNRIPDSVYSKLFAYVNNKNVELGEEEKYYINNNLLIQNVAQYDIIKDRRFISPKYEIHIPFLLNRNANGKSFIGLNNQIDEYVKENKCNIIGIDRGERNLLCATVINKDGYVIDRVCLDKINGVNYNKLLSAIEKDRQHQRRTWNDISQIKNIKKGFVSLAVKAIVDLVEKYGAIICLERLNEGFMNSRSRIEKSIYKEFVNQLINKLSYMVVDKKSSVIDVKQLAFTEFKSMDHNGIIYYVNPAYTSKIDRTTGFASLFKFNNIKTIEDMKKFFENFTDIKFQNNLFKFIFDYSKFETYTDALNGKSFSADSYGIRIKRFKNQNGYWDSKQIDVTQELNNVFANEDKNNIKDIILNNEKICSKVFEIFKLIVQLRNTDNNIDYLVSPIKNKQNFYYDTRKIYYGYGCEDEQSKIECNPDMEASYNIAIKAMLKIYQNKSELKDYFEYFCS